MAMDTLEPRNSRIKDMPEIDAEQYRKGAKRAKEIDAQLNGEEECEAKTKASKLSDFIEVIIKINK